MIFRHEVEALIKKPSHGSKKLELSIKNVHNNNDNNDNEYTKKVFTSKTVQNVSVDGLNFGIDDIEYLISNNNSNVEFLYLNDRKNTEAAASTDNDKTIAIEKEKSEHLIESSSAGKCNFDETS